MDTAQWPQDHILVRPMEDIVQKQPSVERKARPQKELVVNCPRCNSTNTKFCYYNNYSLTQPRYFCKTCRRYWTEGGSLRNIPVGGGSRKNKRPSSSSSSNTSKKFPDLVPPLQQNPNNKTHEPQDLNLGFTNFKNMNELNIPLSNPSSSSPSNASHNFSALELLTGSRGLGSFMTMPITTDPNSVYSSASGFSMPEFRPTLNFSLDGLGTNYGNFQGGQETNGKQLLFPFEDLKQQQVSNINANDNNADQENRDQQNGAADSTGYWINGVIGGGGAW